MKMHAIPRLSLVSALVCGALVLSTSGLVVAQEKDKAGAPPAKKKAEPKGKLPAYYADVVSGDQREKIYDIQKQFTEKIAKLQQELDALVSERDKAVEAVLTPEQKDKVAKAKVVSAEKSKAKKVENAKKKSDENAPVPAAGGAIKPAGVK